MRMIAEILGCPFYLNILDDSIPAEKTEDETDTIQRTENVPAAGTEPAENGETAQSETKEDAGAGNAPAEPGGDSADHNESGGMANERDITIGELVDIHKKLDVLESAVKGSGLDEGGAASDEQQTGERTGEQPSGAPETSAVNAGPESREYRGERPDQEQPEYQGDQAGRDQAEYQGDQNGRDQAEYQGDKAGGNQAE